MEDNIIHSAKQELENTILELNKKYLKTIIVTDENLSFGEIELPATPDDSMTLLRDYFGQKWFAIAKYNYIVYDSGDYTDISIRGELKSLNEFIDKAEQIDYKEARNYDNPLKGLVKQPGSETIKMYEYLRLKHGYYKNTKIPFEKITHTYEMEVNKDNEGKIFEDKSLIAVNNFNDKKVALLRDSSKKDTLSVTASDNLIVAQVYGRYFLFYDFLQAKLKELQPQPEITNQSPKKKSKKEIIKSKKLSDPDIWIGTKKYEEVIKLLKREYREIKHPFIKDISGALTWGKNPAKGWQKYLAGYIYQCNENGFINLSGYSDLEIIAICQNTFAIDKLSPDSFNQAREGSLDKKYIKPFKDLFKEL